MVNEVDDMRDFRENCADWLVFSRNSSGRANAITLSCKCRPPRRPLESGTPAAATNTKWRERTAADVPRACSSEPPEGGFAAEPRLGGFCQLVRVVSRFFDCARQLARFSVSCALYV